ncbi:MAG TPA: FG-GAP repeat protein, partial [Kofleriaceae bacterium]|nr:FG-GAP repeat protein [Kofleriaceae bacterium]
LAVGAYYEASAATGIGGNQADNSAVGAGAAYVFTRSGTTWSPQAYVKASNTEAYDHFGNSIALSGDGSILAVSARAEDSAATGVGSDERDNSAQDAGAVYVFGRSGTTWSQQAYVKASNSEEQDFFGFAIALSADGSTLAVGGPDEDSAAKGIGGDESSNATKDSGATYIYTRSDTTWRQRAYVKSTDPYERGAFGTSVALSPTGAVLITGAPAEHTTAGRVYVYPLP